MNLADNNQNISSLNIFTLIKEVYQSIKNFHKKLDNVSEEQRKLRSYIDKLNNDYDIKYQKQNELLTSISHKVESNEEIDIRLRQDLESKLSSLMSNTIHDTENLNLNLNELTIGNLVDNNYSFNDINEQLQQFNQDSTSIVDKDNEDNNNQSLKYSLDKIQNNINNDVNQDINNLIKMVNNVESSLINDDTNNDDTNNDDINNDDEINIQELSILNNDNNYQNIQKKDISELIFN
jgi:hypothetical protein